MCTTEMHVEMKAVSISNLLYWILYIKHDFVGLDGSVRRVEEVYCFYKGTMKRLREIIRNNE